MPCPPTTICAAFARELSLDSAVLDCLIADGSAAKFLAEDADLEPSKGRLRPPLSRGGCREEPVLKESPGLGQGSCAAGPKLISNFEGRLKRAHKAQKAQQEALPAGDGRGIAVAVPSDGEGDL